MSALNDINLDSVPEHVAIIMDGNGRWAKLRGKARTFGHENGVVSVKECIEACGDLKIKQLTVYAFSTENWSRPKQEVNFLFKLLRSTIKKEGKKLVENKIRLKTIGDLTKFSSEIQEEIKSIEELTSKNYNFTLTIALNYGSKNEIIEATKSIGELIAKNQLKVDEVDEKLFSQHLFTNGLADVDLLIRTSGEKRLSNFLLWQVAYAEFYFTDKLWPDFKKKIFSKLYYNTKREREDLAIHKPH